MYDKFGADHTTETFGGENTTNAKRLSGRRTRLDHAARKSPRRFGSCRRLATVTSESSLKFRSASKRDKTHDAELLLLAQCNLWQRVSTHNCICTVKVHLKVRRAPSDGAPRPRRPPARRQPRANRWRPHLRQRMLAHTR